MLRLLHYFNSEVKPARARKTVKSCRQCSNDSTTIHISTYINRTPSNKQRPFPLRSANARSDIMVYLHVQFFSLSLCLLGHHEQGQVSFHIGCQVDLVVNVIIPMSP